MVSFYVLVHFESVPIDLISFQHFIPIHGAQPLVPMMSDPLSPHSSISNHEHPQLRAMKTPHELHVLQHHPSYVPNVAMQNMGDVAQQAEPPHKVHENVVRNRNESEMKANDIKTVYGTSNGDLVTTDYDDDAMYTTPANDKRRETKGAPPQYHQQQQQQPVELETEGMGAGAGGGTFYGTEGAEGTDTGQQLNYMATQGGMPGAGPQLKSTSNNSDDDVLSDDFVAEVQPDPKATPNGVNLYFLDPQQDPMYAKGGGTKGGQ